MADAGDPVAHEHWLTATDGVRLFVRDYRPQSAANRTILWCHGVCEHGGKYGHVISRFLARGWRVVLPDLRGHGRSEGIRADVASFDVYLKDFDQVAAHFQLNPKQTALFGHSMGGLIISRFAETRQQGWPALALSAPLLGVAVPIPWWRWWLGQALATVAPRTHLRTGIREDNLTSDPTFLAARRADPFIQRRVTVRWYFAMRAALEAVHRDARQLTLPVLILQGLKDQTTDPRASANWLSSISSSDRQLIQYPDGLHELLNDRDWQTVCDTLLKWLDERVRFQA